MRQIRIVIAVFGWLIGSAAGVTSIAAQTPVSFSDFVGVKSTISTSANIEGWKEPDGTTYQKLYCDAAAYQPNAEFGPYAWKVGFGADWLTPGILKSGVRCHFSIIPPVLLSPDYQVDWRLSSTANYGPGSFSAFGVRTFDADNFYAVGIRVKGSNPDLWVWKTVNGVDTILATANCDISARAKDNDPADILRTTIQGDMLSVEKRVDNLGDFVPCLPPVAMGNVIPHGLPSVGQGNFLVAGDRQDGSLGIGSITVTDLNGAPGPPPLTSVVTIEGDCGSMAFSVDLAAQTAPVPAGAQTGCRVTVEID